VDAAIPSAQGRSGARFTRFTATKVQMLTQKLANKDAEVLALLALLVQKYKY
jgi:hypothetical protein